MSKKDEPLVKGGQGRTDESVVCDAKAMTGILIGCGLGLLVWAIVACCVL